MKTTEGDQEEEIQEATREPSCCRMRLAWMLQQQLLSELEATSLLKEEQSSVEKDVLALLSIGFGKSLV